MKKLNIIVIATVSLMLFGINAQALVLTPGFINGTSCDTSTDPACWSGTTPNNPKADDVEALSGATDLVELYKAEVGDPVVEEGDLAASYVTRFLNDPLDPMDAQIDHVFGTDSVACPSCYLLVKDGDQNPSWYIFDISFWDGTETIYLEDFWPNQGAISHISIFGNSMNVPEPSVLMLIGLGLLGLGLARKQISH